MVESTTRSWSSLSCFETTPSIQVSIQKALATLILYFKYSKHYIHWSDLLRQNFHKEIGRVRNILRVYNLLKNISHFVNFQNMTILSRRVRPVYIVMNIENIILI